MITNDTPLENIQQLFRTAGEAGLQKIDFLHFIDHHLRPVFTHLDAIDTIKVVAESGLRNEIRLDDYHFAATTSHQDFAEFVRVVGSSGLTSLNFNIFLGKYQEISYKDIIQFMYIAGKNGVRDITLPVMLASIGFEIAELIKPFEHGSTSLRNIYLGSIHLFGNSNDLIRFVQLAGKSGVRSLTFGNRSIGDLLDDDSFLEFLTASGASGI